MDYIRIETYAPKNKQWLSNASNKIITLLLLPLKETELTN